MILLVGLALILLWVAGRSPRWPPPPRDPEPCALPAAVIAPIAGEVPDLKSFLDALRAQDHPDFHVILVIEEERERCGGPLEAAVQIAALERRKLLDGMRVVRAARACRSSQKAANLVAGLDAIGDEAIVVLVDVDARPHPSWLSDLVRPLGPGALAMGERKPRVTTGFRWYVPGEGPGSLLRSVFSAAALGMVSDPERAFAWGGSLAMRREDLDRLAIARAWSTALSDDMAVTAAVRAAGGEIRFVPEGVIPSFGEISLGGVTEFAVRQVAMLKWGSTFLWATSLAYHAALAATQLGALAVALDLAAVPGGLAGRMLSAGILALPTALAVVRTNARFGLLASRPLGQVAGWDRHRFAHVALAPVMTWFMLASHLVAAARREIDWCGIRYRLGPGRAVSVVSGPCATGTEPGSS